MMKTLMPLIFILATAGCVQQIYEYDGPGEQQNNQTRNQTPPITPPPGQIPPSPTPPPSQQNPDDGTLGSLNHGYLQPHPYTRIILEIDYVAGHEPTSATRNAMSSFFQNVAGKPVTFSGGNVITSTKNTYMVNDLLDVEKTNRQHYTNGGTAVVYFMFINGQFENPGALGVAFKASSAALFVERIDDATSALILYPQIERAVAVHELGHLMGLVNINYRSERSHEDAQHRGHSSNQNSVMFWAVEDISLKNVLNLGPPDQFDSDDLHDLQKIREGTY